MSGLFGSEKAVLIAPPGERIRLLGIGPAAGFCLEPKPPPGRRRGGFKMTNENLEGGLKSTLGRGQEALGDITGDAGTKLEGERKQFAGQAEKAIGAAKDGLNKAASQARAAASVAADRASDYYGRAANRAQVASESMQQFVDERPYSALAVAAVAGLLLGALIFAT